MNRVFHLIIPLLICAASMAQLTTRLDLRPGFREFKFKTTHERYDGQFSFHKTDFYHWPEILDIYHCPYSVQIGNTRTDSVHVFFLGNQLVRTTVFLKDSLTLSYLQKNFGPAEPINEKPLTLEQAAQLMLSAKHRYMYVNQYRWQADMVRMEQKVMYILVGNKAIKRYCLDFYLIDFKDMMRSITEDWL